MRLATSLVRSCARAVSTSSARHAAAPVATVSSKAANADDALLSPTIAEVVSSRVPGDAVVVQGWVRSRRKSKTMAFAVVNDGSTFRGLQVATPSVHLLDGLHAGTCVRVEGHLSAAANAAGESVELVPSRVQVLGACEDKGYPLAGKRHSLEHLRTVGHLRSRTNTFGAMWRVRDEATFAVHEYFREYGFRYIATPLVTTNDCEGGGEVFRVTADATRDRGDDDAGGGPRAAPDRGGEFFGTPAFLTVSGQLHLEMVASGLARVYNFGPCFRAEYNSRTSRHLAEFHMVEAEAAFVTQLPQLFGVVEGLVRHVARHVVRTCADDVAFFHDRVDRTLTDRLDLLCGGGGGQGDAERGPFVRTTYAEVLRILADNEQALRASAADLCDRNEGAQVSAAAVSVPRWGDDLSSVHERFLCDHYFEGRPVFVADWPSAVKPFYMRENEPDASGHATVAAFDLLMPRVGELFGGSLREERLNVLDTRMQAAFATGGEGTAEWEACKASLAWYRDLRSFGASPHGGFGMGFERLLQLLTGTGNIRDTIPFPRAPNSCAA